MRNIADILEERILKGSYRVNEKLPGLNLLAEEFGVSYGTVHAAVRRLADKRLVVVEQGRGTYVLGSGPMAVEWVIFGNQKANLQSTVIENSLDFLKRYWQDANHPEILLNLNLLDVRNIPPPDIFAEACRMRGLRGLLVQSHGVHFLDYVKKVARATPVVSLFGQWGGDGLHSVSPDFKGAIDEIVTEWKRDGAKALGLCTLRDEDHPNYREFNQAVSSSAREHDLRLNREDCFYGRPDDALNWVTGKIAFGDHPRHWITISSSFAGGIVKAADKNGLKMGRDIHAFAIDMTDQSYHKFGKRFTLATQQLDQTILAGIRLLERLIGTANDQSEDAGNVLVPLKILPAKH